jgi:hypothetical protein
VGDGVDELLDRCRVGPVEGILGGEQYPVGTGEVDSVTQQALLQRPRWR